MTSPTVKELGRGLPVGGSRSGLECPKCHGGRTRERSLSVYRNEGGIGGRCHRASCGLNVFRPAVSNGETRPAFKPNPYPYPLAIPAPDNVIWDALRVPAALRDARASRCGDFVVVL